MKITRNNPEQLIIENRPWVVSLGLVAGGLVFLGIGLMIVLNGELLGLTFMGGSLLPFGMLFIFARRVQVLFLRTEGKLVFQRRSLLGSTKVEHQLNEISEAIVQTSHGTGDSGPTHRVALVFSEGQSAGTHPLTMSYDNFSNHDQTASTINLWLARKP
ncbi:MAG: hypothetical protein ABJN34_09350 [Litoreibacter sp.]|uniref:hypothetical protein n=1 Tax=Litoreibacter sp. TaxID=1969459 RepID=UPI0032968E28